MEFTYTVTDRIAEVVMNQPPVNAFNSTGWNNLAKTIRAAGEDPSVNVVILRAEGRGFCAGVDIKELAADGSKIVAVNKGCYDSFRGRAPLQGASDRGDPWLCARRGHRPCRGGRYHRRL